MRYHEMLPALLIAAISLAPASAIDDALSYKSLVLGSLASGQMASGRVSTSSCHNYYMNVTDIGYSLVVDLNTSSSALFLLVKASPILRHSLEDEHNYANYYQFKKQGGHHGVVVTSDHLSPGRWYIGVCNYVQEVPSFDEKKRGKGSAGVRATTEYAEYAFIPTLDWSPVSPSDDDCGPECQEKETEARIKLEQSAPELSKSRNCLEDRTCEGGFTGFTVDPVRPHSPIPPREQPMALSSSSQQAGETETSTPLEEGLSFEPIGECGGPVPMKTGHAGSGKRLDDEARYATTSSRALDAAVVLFLVALAGGVFAHFHRAKGGAPAVMDSQQSTPSVSSSSGQAPESPANEDKIHAQLEEARKACERLERQLQEERLLSQSKASDCKPADGAVEETRSHGQASSSVADEAIASATKAFTERFYEEKERQGMLTSEAEKWRQAAEDAQAKMLWLQREKAAAERAAEVLENEVNMTRRQMLELRSIDDKSKPITSAVGQLHLPPKSLSSGRLSSLIGGCPPLLGTSGELFSTSLRFSSPGGFHNSFSCPSSGSSSAAVSPYHKQGQTAPQTPHAQKFFGDVASHSPHSGRPPVHPSPERLFNRGGSMPSMRDAINCGGSLSSMRDAINCGKRINVEGSMRDAINSDAFAAFMGVDLANSDLLGELEPSLSPARGVGGMGGEGGEGRGSRSGSETRARGRRGGQRRKRAAGDANSENAATDSLATSMALAALGDGDS